MKILKTANYKKAQRRGRFFTRCKHCKEIYKEQDNICPTCKISEDYCCLDCHEELVHDLIKEYPNKTTNEGWLSLAPRQLEKNKWANQKQKR